MIIASPNISKAIQLSFVGLDIAILSSPYERNMAKAVPVDYIVCNLAKYHYGRATVKYIIVNHVTRNLDEPIIIISTSRVPTLIYRPMLQSQNELKHTSRSVVFKSVNFPPQFSTSSNIQTPTMHDDHDNRFAHKSTALRTASALPQPMYAYPQYHLPQTFEHRNAIRVQSQ